MTSLTSPQNFRGLFYTKIPPYFRRDFCWGECQNDIITILSDREYMTNVKDKIKAIKIYNKTFKAYLNLVVD